MATATATKPVSTETKLAEMLREDTGRALCDSGDAYGRHWQRNQGVNFADSPEGELEWNHRGEKVDIDATVSVYHFLLARLSYNEELDKRFRAYVDQDGDWPDAGGAESYVQSLEDTGEVVTVNTYNGESVLSQTLAYVYWVDDDGAHVLLQIHGGCDVRGGYTDAVAFDVDEDYSIFGVADASIYCSDCNHYWQTDDSCNWYDEGVCGVDYINLEDYPVVTDRPNYPEKRDPAQISLPVDLPERPVPTGVALWIDDDDKGHCPYCGGLLHLSGC